jgi:DNA-binding SARP family transcriptional activator
MMGASCRVTLLGRFEVAVDGRPLDPQAWRHRRAADLVKLLALQPNHRMHRERAIDALWPELGPEAGGANLRKAVHYVRRTLSDERAVSNEGDTLSLWASGELRVDVDAFEHAGERAIRDGDGDAAGEAADLYPGDLLPDDLYVSWADERRERLRDLHARLLRLAARWDRVLEIDRSDEEAHRALMRSRFEAGDRHGAMRQFERLREALHADMGVGPDQETISLYEKILSADGDEPPGPAEQVQGLLARGLLDWSRMDLDPAREAAERARTIALDAGLGRELGEASGLLGLICHAQGRWRELFREEFLQALEESPDLAGFVFDAHLCLAEFSLYEPAGPAEAASFARELLSIAHKKESERGRALATLMLGEADLLSGSLEEAERYLSEAEGLYRSAAATTGSALALERLGELALAEPRGRTRAARYLREALPHARASSLAPHLVVRVHGAEVQREDDPRRAKAAIDRIERELSRADVCQLCSMGYVIAAAIAEARAGDLDASRRHVSSAERVAGMWQGGPWQAAVWEARAELRLCEAEPAQAAGLFREAAARFAVTGRPLDEARCRAAAEASEPS